MARPRKNNADWFSHDTGLRDNLKVKAVRAKYGLEWYAIFVMILEVLADAENFVLEDNEFQTEMLAGDFRIDSDKLKDILDYFKKIWLIQFEDWKIFNEHLIERMEPLLTKRQTMRQKHQEKKVSVAETPVSEEETPQKPQKPKVEKMSEEDFESFWKIYPVKEEKKKAKEKFLKLEKSLLPKILEAIEENKTKNDKWLKWFIKQPTTWINGECWNDELKPLIPNPANNAKSVWNSRKTQGWIQWKVSTDWHADLVV